ncbi:MAG: hypothetical protein JO222_02155 [Frankiales bacterium]|nr:hypothetical protein [Frankiales bacterium]
MDWGAIMVDRWKRLAPLAGVVMVGCLVGVLATGSSPGADASGARVLQYFNHHHHATQVGLVLCAVAAAAGILYFASIARLLRDAGSQLLAQTTMAGGIIFSVAFTLAAGTAAILTDHQDKLGLSTLQTLNVIQNDLWWPSMIVGLAVATLSMGVAMLRTKAMPKALGIITTIVGVVAFTGIGSWFAFLGSGPLVLVIAGYAYQRMGMPQSITMPDVPGQRAVTEAPASEESKA